MTTSLWGWRSYEFALPLMDLVKIAAATCAMLFCVKIVAPIATPASIALAIAAGGIVYAATLAAVYPALTSQALAKTITMDHVRHHHYKENLLKHL